MNYESPSCRASRTIRSILADRRLSVEALSQGTGIALSTLKRRLGAASPFSIDELGMVAAFLEVPIADVLVPIGDRAAVMTPEKKPAA